MNQFKIGIFKKSTSGITITPSTSFNFSIACDSGVAGGANCCPVAVFPQTFYCGDNPIVVGSIIYEGAVGGLELVGANLWHKEQSSGNIFRIDNEGVVIAMYSCGSPPTSGEYTFSNGVVSKPESCEITTYPITLFCVDEVISVGSVMTDDIGGASPWAGGGLWHKEQSSGKSYLIGNNGIVAEIHICGESPVESYVMGITLNTFPSLQQACALYESIEGTVYCANAPVTTNNVLYTDQQLTVPFNGGGLVYVTSYLDANSVGHTISVMVDNNGLITTAASC